MGRSFVKVIKENCKLEDGNDTKLPYTCYIITYKVDGADRYDLAVGDNQVSIFDYYYDLYKKNFVTMKQSQGRVRPNLWNVPEQKPKKKKST